MSYIKREPLLQIAQKLQGDAFGAPLIVRAIEEAPGEDVVEVVRCKDCMYSFMSITGKTVLYCDMRPSDDHLELDKDYYCADGERRMDNDSTRT